jgi:hypothetical protein
MKLSLSPKLVEKLVRVPVILFYKNFILNYKFDALLCRNWPFLPPNHVTLLISLVYSWVSKHLSLSLQSLSKFGLVLLWMIDDIPKIENTKP